ncbi:hypothetical protein [Acidithiobacillus thiooxidans]|uniref:hypothetical protein n=1 Tax=Acidithiobacillus thiooxidans TaxID=930 RepID=UPI00356728B6
MRFHVRIGIALNAQKYIFLGGIYNISPDALTDGAIIQCGLEPSGKVGSNTLSGVLARLEGEVLGPHAQYREALWLEAETKSGQSASIMGVGVISFLQNQETDPEEAIKRLYYHLASRFDVKNLRQQEIHFQEVFNHLPCALSWAF